jgi:hypothetical protein
VWEDDTAASAISALFWLAFVLLFAVAVAGLLMGTSQQATTAPEVTFSFDGNTEQLRISHVRGDKFEGEQVTIEGSATDFKDGSSISWAQAPEGTSGTVTKGDSILLGTDATRRYGLKQGKLKLVWHDPAVDASVALDAYQVKTYERRPGP